MTKKNIIKITVLLVLLFVAYFVFGQGTDGFFQGQDWAYEDRDADFISLYIAINGFGDEPAPVGAGLGILTFAGLAYGAIKRKKK